MNSEASKKFTSPTLLKAEIRRFVIIHGNDDQRQLGSCLEGILRTLMTQIELSPITKDSCCFDGEINFEIGAGDIARAQLAANTVRSVAYNMLNLSELLLLLVDYIIRSGASGSRALYSWKLSNRRH